MLAASARAARPNHARAKPRCSALTRPRVGGQSPAEHDGEIPAAMRNDVRTRPRARPSRGHRLDLTCGRGTARSSGRARPPSAARPTPAAPSPRVPPTSPAGHQRQHQPRGDQRRSAVKSDVGTLQMDGRRSRLIRPPRRPGAGRSATPPGRRLAAPRRASPKASRRGDRRVGVRDGAHRGRRHHRVPRRPSEAFEGERRREREEQDHVTERGQDEPVRTAHLSESTRADADAIERRNRRTCVDAR